MRLAIVSYSQAIEGVRQLNSDIQTDRAVLSRQYASLITLGLQDQDNVTCDFDAMRRSKAFRNDLADSSYRHEAYVHEVVIDQRDLRVQLHALLDRELQITHSDQEQQNLYIYFDQDGRWALAALVAYSALSMWSNWFLFATSPMSWAGVWVFIFGGLALAAFMSSNRRILGVLTIGHLFMTIYAYFELAPLEYT